MVSFNSEKDYRLLFLIVKKKGKNTCCEKAYCYVGEGEGGTVISAFYFF